MSMKHHKLPSRIVGVLAVIGLGAAVLPARADVTLPNFVYNQAYQALGTDPNANDATTALQRSWSGAFQYDLPIALPPGRHQLTPQLNLHYDNQDNDQASWLGVGWSLSIPSIRRTNIYGVNSMYTRTDFTSSRDGKLLVESLTDSQHGSFVPETDNGSKTTYTYNTDGSWQVVDASGTTYVYGVDTNARIDQPSDSSVIYAWYLSSITDTNGNVITYSYTKDQGQIYPDTITYADTFTIDFVLTGRDDQLTRFTPGFEVRTYYVIDRIDIQVAGTTTRSYDFTYTKPGDGRERFLLNSVTETGYDDTGTATTLPPTEFDYQLGTGGWSEDASWSIPTYFASYGSTTIPADDGVRIFDVNGDDLPDLVQAVDDYSSAVWSQVWINTGSSWSLDSGYSVPVGFTDRGLDIGTRIADINGDGYIDLIKSYGGSESSHYETDGVYLNDPASKTWVRASSYTIPMTFVVNPGSTPQGTAARLVDVNGDQLPDFVFSIKSSSGSYTGDETVYINSGSGWSEDTAYELPIAIGRQIYSDIAEDLGVGFADVNGDGLTDLLNGTEGVYLNQGLSKTWTKTSGWNLPGNFVDSTSGGASYDSGLRLLDINGDHLDDLAVALTGYTGHYDGSSFANFLNYNDQSWFEASDTTFPIPVGFIEWYGSGMPSVDEGTRFTDANGDGMIDIIKKMSNHGDEADNGVYLNQGSVTDLLTSITLPTGGSIAIDYATPTPADNPSVQFPIQVVAAVTTDDGLGNSVTTTYDYAGGAYYGSTVENRRFAGFSTITETTDHRSITYYYDQGTAGVQTIGKVIQTDYRDAMGNLQATRFSPFAITDQFIYPTQTVNSYFASDGSHVDSAIQYSYDTTTDHLLTHTDLGKVTADSAGNITDVSGDTYTTTYTYATPTTGSIMNKPDTIIVTNPSGSQLRETRNRYDDLAEGSVAAGNLTTQQVWVSGSHYADTSYTYTSQGLLETTTDPTGNVTTNTYDSTALYPETVTNALSQITTYSYDLTSGKVTSQTDANGNVTTTSFDGLDRPLEQTEAGETTHNWNYNDTALPISTTTTDWLDASNSVTHYEYRDGFNRMVQQRDEMATSDIWAVTDKHYNAEAMLDSQSLPYSASGSAYTTPTSTTSLLTTATYDALNRLLTETNAVGTTSHVYSNWQDVVTDPAGKIKTFTYNAQGALVNVIEQVGTSQYTTTYTVDGDRLTTIQDASSNTASFTYDGRGLQLTAQDLHAPIDTTFGSSTNSYDDNGQMITLVDANGNTITQQYDELKRLTSKDDAATSTADEAYTYDTCTQGVGRLCSVTVGSDVSTSYQYDARGRITSENKTIAGTSYTTNYTYDRAGNILTLTYPDNSVTTYTYNSAGQPATVSFYDGRSRSTSTIVSATSYAPTGRPSSITAGSGSVTNLTYDAAELYRLTNKTTTNGSTTLQNLTYDYDAIGNITSIADAASIYTNVAYTYTYDDLYRLKTAQAVQGSTSLYNHTYAYSRIGNLASSTGLGGYTYGGTSAGNYANPHAVTRVASKTYTYDHNGNLTSNGSLTSNWNFKNQITSQTSGSTNYTYTYDHTGARAYKTKVTSTATTVSIYPNDYYDIEGTSYRRHISHPLLGSLATSTYVSTTRTSRLIYHLTDHLGSTTVDTNSSGTYQEYMIYFPFGKVKTDQRVAGASNDDYKFTGQELDDTNLYYYGARYYDPTIYLFLSQDPAAPDLRNPQSLNDYSYAFNNPLRYNDPTGQTACEVNWKEVGLGALAIAGAAVVVVGLFTGASEAAIGLAVAYDISGAAVSFGGGSALVIDGLSGHNRIDTTLTAENAIDYFADTPISPSQMMTLHEAVETKMQDLANNKVGQTTSDNQNSSSTNTISTPVTAPAASAPETCPSPTTTPSATPSYSHVNTTLSAPDNSSWFTRAQNYIQQHSSSTGSSQKKK